MYLYLFVVFLGSVLVVGGQNPTAVCYPPVFQTTYFNMITEDKGNIYVDFSKEIWSERSLVTGIRVMHDFTNLRSYVIRGEGNFTMCESYRLRQSQIMFPCLPAYAKLVPGASGFLHHITAVKMTIQTWDIQTEYDVVHRIVFSVVGGQPYWPIMSQQYGYHGTTDVYIYTNPAPTIGDQSVFKIPDSCSTRDISLPNVVG